MTAQSEPIVKMPLTWITKSENNPRKNRNNEDFSRLKLSMKETKGVIHPITVRKTGVRNKYELVTGESRYEAAACLKWAYIDTVVKILSDDEVAVWRGHENIVRSAMSPIEEAEWAVNRLKNNSKADTAAQLGWSIKRLDARILLTHCSSSVRNYLAQRTISLTMAELLATLPTEIQDLAIKAIVAEKLSVNEAKSRVKKLSRDLSTACFDTDDCKGCNNNTARYVDLFETIDFSTQKGLCTNQPCWQQKTIDKVGEIKSEAEQSFSRVEYSTKIATDAIAIIATDGAQGVGHEQSRACAACEDFGVIIDSRQGREGNQTNNVCFNTTCNAGKVTTYQKFIAQMQAQTTESTDTGTVSQRTVSLGGKQASKPKVETKAAAKVIKKSVQTYAMRLFSDMAAKEVVKNDLTQVVNVIALIESSDSNALGDKENKIHSTISINRSSKDRIFKFLVTLNNDELSQLEQHLVQSYLRKGSFDTTENDPYRQLNKALLNHVTADISNHWVMDESYLKINAKPVVEQLLLESGFVDNYEAVETNKFSNSTMKVMIAATESHVFEFAGFIPEELKTLLNPTAKKETTR